MRLLELLDIEIKQLDYHNSVVRFQHQNFLFLQLAMSFTQKTKKNIFFLGSFFSLFPGHGNSVSTFNLIASFFSGKKTKCYTTFRVKPHFLFIYFFYAKFSPTWLLTQNCSSLSHSKQFFYNLQFMTTGFSHSIHQKHTFCKEIPNGYVPFALFYINFYIQKE